jgi:hypothetical protein
LVFVWNYAWDKHTLRVMLQATKVITIRAPVEAVWQVISDFGAGARYLAMVTHCIVQGTGTGALRTLTYLDGSVISERLEMVDEAAKSLNYSLLTDTAFGNCLLTIRLRARSSDRTELTWAARFRPTSLPVNEAWSLMEGMLMDNCQVLKQFLER